MADLKNYMVGNDKKTVEQIDGIVSSPAFTDSKVRIMPDAHAGKGCVVGTTATYTDKIVPSVVGVDIACRVSLFKIPADFDFAELDAAIHKVVPTGFAVHNKIQFDFDYSYLRCWDAMENKPRLERSLGTLGGGNHFIAVDVDEETGQHYLAIHCGSRNLGKQVCEYYQAKAVAARDARVEYIHHIYDVLFSIYHSLGMEKYIQEEVEKRNEKIETLRIADDLCYLEGEDMEDYLNDMDVCNNWSWINHRTIYKNIAAEMGWE